MRGQRRAEQHLTAVDTLYGNDKCREMYQNILALQLKNTTTH
jgi:hypothetical protein